MHTASTNGLTVHGQERGVERSVVSVSKDTSEGEKNKRGIYLFVDALSRIIRMNGSIPLNNGSAASKETGQSASYPPQTEAIPKVEKRRPRSWQRMRTLFLAVMMGISNMRPVEAKPNQSPEQSKDKTLLLVNSIFGSVDTVEDGS